MQTYHEWNAEGKHYRAVIDEDYWPDKCCGESVAGKHGGNEKGQFCKPEDRCEENWQEEVDKLESGKWVALGVIVSEPCRGLKAGIDLVPTAHCECCSGRKETDSLWGIVVENSHEAIEKFVREGM